MGQKSKRTLQEELEHMKKQLEAADAPCKLVKDEEAGRFVVECREESTAQEIATQLLRDGSLTVRLRKQKQDQDGEG